MLLKHKNNMTVRISDRFPAKLSIFMVLKNFVSCERKINVEDSKLAEIFH